MIEIAPNLKIEENEVRLDFVRSSGPGGQNVNKVATAVQLRFDVRHSPALPADVKARLYHLAGTRITRDGVLVIEAKRYRTQDQNREDAIQRLVGLIRKALVRPKARRKTGPTASARAKRLESKRRRGAIKRIRRSAGEE